AAPVQVVWRHAELPVREVAPGQLSEQRLDLSQAPLIRLLYARDPANGRVLGTLVFHHIALDHTALDVVREEMQACLLGQAEALPAAVPYRNYVAQARWGISEEEHETFFRQMLGDIEEPTLPFGLRNVSGTASDVEEVCLPLSEALAQRLRSQARSMGISVASLFHLAWAQVLAVTSGQRSVVFGTVLMGRMQGGAGADRGLGMFINTLPLRVDIGGQTVRDGV
ncbi:condensation domain-containing protein, partial [Pseudomonas botevensis]|uniref:condensation domain-containing protein n=1 Tax=Pseudomonas botevensis TaxID=2842352 RepID=UPI001CECB046